MQVTADPEVRAIEELITKWIAATNAGEGARLGKLVSDDAVFLAPGGVAFRGREAFLAGQKALEGYRVEVRGEVEEVQVAGDWAWAWTTLWVQVEPRAGGESVLRSGPTLSIYRKEGGHWALHRDANLLAVAQEDMPE